MVVYRRIRVPLFKISPLPSTVTGSFRIAEEQHINDFVARMANTEGAPTTFIVKGVSHIVFVAPDESAQRRLSDLHNAGDLYMVEMAANTDFAAQDN